MPGDITMTATVGDVIYDLNNLSKYLWLADEGLGMSPLHRIVERGPQQHGEADLGFQLDPRVIKLAFGMFGSGWNTDDPDIGYWDAREEFLLIFAPTTEAIKLTFGLPNGKTRQIDVHLAGELTFPSTDRKRTAQKVGVLLRAKDPTFYDPELKSYTYNAGGGSTGFTIPMPVPTPIGTTSINQTRTIQYGGTWDSLPIVIIRGPITSPIVTNVTTGELLDFTGYTISSGDYYTIDTGFGVKTVTDSLGVSQISKLTEESDLNNFHLERRKANFSGANDIRVFGSTIGAATEIYFQFYERFIGM